MRMKRTVLILIIGFLLIRVNLYAGDFIVEGNVGIGTTEPLNLMQFGSQGALDYQNSAEFVVRYNNYYSGGDRWLRGTNKAAVFILDDNGYRFLTSPNTSTGAGNLITNFGEVMRITQEQMPINSINKMILAQA